MRVRHEKMAQTRAANTMRKARLIRQMVDEHYEPGRQDRNRKWVYRNIVVKIYPMSLTTFWRYMRLTRNEADLTDKANNAGQLRLF
ncbi:MAG: hypothetical protein IPM52_13305 [Bacteroidetes bacterium]|nr:hypothetical protein [Bacteroidota bacterium]